MLPPDFSNQPTKAQGESEAVPPEGAQVQNAGGGQLQQHAELGGEA